jgi:uncharacterized protein (DUF1697 family)
MTFIALLRAINLGSHKPIAMSALRDFIANLSFTDARTSLQTGNVVFRGKARSTGELEHLLEIEAKARLGLDTDFFVRSAKDWKALVNRNPFPDEARRDPSHLVVMFLKDAPDAKSLATLRAAIKGPETVDVTEKQAYMIYPAGIGRSRVTHALIEAKLGTRGTGRNWNTVLKLAAALAAEMARTEDTVAMRHEGTNTEDPDSGKIGETVRNVQPRRIVDGI